MCADDLHISIELRELGPAGSFSTLSTAIFKGASLGRADSNARLALGRGAVASWSGLCGADTSSKNAHDSAPRSSTTLEDVDLEWPLFLPAVAHSTSRPSCARERALARVAEWQTHRI